MILFSKETAVYTGLSVSLLGMTGVKPSSPNVLLVMFDDMNNLGIPGQAPYTPNLDAFRKTAVLFTHNQCPAPLCNPSRCAIMSGVSPHQSGIFTNEQNPWESGGVFNTLETLPECFRKNGYESIIAGKIFHNDKHFTAEQLDAMFDDHEMINGGYGPFPTDPAIPAEEIAAKKWLNYQIWEGPDSDFPDVVNTDKLVSELSIANRTQPFFMSLGLYRPHNPYTAPARFFEMNPTNSIVLPPYLENDLSDVPPIGQELVGTGEQALKIREGDWLVPLVRAYYSCISFADWNFGRVMSALENSPYADNTIVVVCADNGFHNGEKEHWGKKTLWEKSANTLLMMRVPGLTATDRTCESAVSLISLYPTLVDLCSLNPPDHLFVGQSLRDVLAYPETWASPLPALTCHLARNYSLRDSQFRYIHYSDGTEELYDHFADPNEWTNIADNVTYADIKSEFLAFLPLQASALVEEHFATSMDTSVGNVPGWTTVAKFENNLIANPKCQLQTGGKSYGTTITGIDGLKSAAQDGYVFNSAGRIANLICRSITPPIDFSEGDTLYFSALVSGVNRAGFGLGNVISTNYPDQLLLIGVQPQISSTETTPKDFGSAVWLGDLTQVHENSGIAISGDSNTVHLIIGRIVNNAAGTDEISYHVIDRNSSVDVPSVWTESALAGEVGYYSRTDYEFGGDLVFSNLFVNLQNNSGLDEIYVSGSYQEIIPGY